MCGISGALAFDERHVPRDRALRRVHGRSDGAPRARTAPASWVDAEQRVGFAHRRLSIIDLSTAASQPMSNEDGTLWLTYNGEIYNHAELRARTGSKLGAPRWKTDHSDTEVILHAFEEWGIDCLSRVPRHVRVRVVGRARPRAVAGARSHRHQAAVLQRPPRPADVRVGDQGAASRIRSSRARSTSARCSITCRF